ncbi:MAG: hypothetical protein B7Z16_17125, partial [Algoriphagus sp. 32-45-6]
MKELGLISKLTINRFTDFGAYLALSDGGEVLLPKGYLTGEEKEGDEVEVFVYTDSEDRPVAVTQRPLALLDEFAVLEAKEVTDFGAFMAGGEGRDGSQRATGIHTRMVDGPRLAHRWYGTSATSR